MNDMNEREITLEALADLPESAYVLYDVRDAVSHAYGTIPGAAGLPDPEGAAEAGAPLLHARNTKRGGGRDALRHGL